MSNCLLKASKASFIQPPPMETPPERPQSTLVSMQGYRVMRRMLARGFLTGAVLGVLAGCAETAPKPAAEPESATALDRMFSRPSERSGGPVAATPAVETSPTTLREPAGRRSVSQTRSGVPLTPTGGGARSRGGLTVLADSIDLRAMLDLVVRGQLGRSYVIADDIDPKLKLFFGGDVPLEQADAVLRGALAVAGLEVRESHGVYLIRRNTNAPPPLASGDRVAVIRLNFLSAEDFIALSSDFIEQDRLRAVPGDPGTLIFLGTTQQVEGLRRIQALLDVYELSNTKITLTPLKRARVETVAPQVNRALGLDQRSGFPRLIPIPAQNAMMIVAPGGFDTTDIQLTIEALDVIVADEAEPVRAFKPRNRKAQEVHAMLRSLAQQQTDAAQTAIPAAFDVDRPTQQGQQSARASQDATALLENPTMRPSNEKGREAVGTSGGAEQKPSESGGAGFSARNGGQAGNAVQSGRAPQGGKEAATSETGDSAVGLRQLTRATSLDLPGNRILFTGTAEQFAILRRVLEELDSRKPQILIEAAILEVTLTKDLAMGVQYSINQGALQLNRSIVGQLTASGAVSRSLPGLVLDLGAGGATVIVNALSAITDVSVVSSPKVLVTNGDEANINFGSNVPYLTSTATQTQQGAFTQANQISYRNTGVELTVSPWNIDDRKAELVLDQRISDISATSLGAIQSPVFTDRRLRTRAIIQFGETILLGGIIQQRNEDGGSGLPGLRDVPILGGLFGSRRQETERRELVLLLTPRIYYDDAERILKDGLNLRFERAFDILAGRNLSLSWREMIGIDGVAAPRPPVKIEEFPRP